jgi:hypothetical protein
MVWQEVDEQFVNPNRLRYHVFPMTSRKSSEHIASMLREFIDDDDGIPNELVCNLASEQVGHRTPMMLVIFRQYRIRLYNAEQGRNAEFG